MDPCDGEDSRLLKHKVQQQYEGFFIRRRHYVKQSAVSLYPHGNKPAVNHPERLRSAPPPHPIQLSVMITALVSPMLLLVKMNHLNTFDPEGLLGFKNRHVIDRLNLLYP